MYFDQACPQITPLQSLLYPHHQPLFPPNFMCFLSLFFKPTEPIYAGSMGFGVGPSARV